MTHHSKSRYRSPSKCRRAPCRIDAHDGLRKWQAPCPASSNRAMRSLRILSCCGFSIAISFSSSLFQPSITDFGSVSARRKVTAWISSGESKCGRYPRECQPLCFGSSGMMGLGTRVCDTQDNGWRYGGLMGNSFAFYWNASHRLAFPARVTERQDR